MPQTCPACAQTNRDIARYCKACGRALAVAGDDPLDGLIGLDALRQALKALKATLAGMKRHQSATRLAYHLMVIGHSGTAKSCLGDRVAALLHSQGVSSKATAVTLDARQRDTLKPADLDQLFASAKGGVLFLDHAHALVHADGSPEPLLLRLFSLIDTSPDDPVVVVAGQPHGLRAFLARDENKGLTGHFQAIFSIPDYSAAQLAAIAEQALAKQGFSLAAEARDRLKKRFEWLFKASRQSQGQGQDQGQVQVSAQNGKLALREAEAIRNAYFQRQATDRVILAGDIAGEVAEAKSVEQILAELDGFIGMDNIKAEVRALHGEIAQRQALAARGRADLDLPALHVVITGNPGTGKTSVSRVLGEIFQALGVLDSGHVVEVDRASMIAQYQGQTGPLVNAQCDKALGGLLFIDEAYGLHQGDGDSFGQQAVDALLKRMEDDRGKFIVVAAGYQGPMAAFLASNPGFKSRFNRFFHIDDYSPEQLAAIFSAMVARQGFGLGPGAAERVLDFFKDRCGRKTRDFANGREARTLLEQTQRAQSARLLGLGRLATDAEMLTLEAADIPVAGAETGSKEAALARLNALVGLAGVKTAVAGLANRLAFQRLRGDTAPLARHFVFTGNPGTGKTTVARILADIFHAIGLLPSNTLVEADRSRLVSQYANQTAVQVNALCDSALGGVLFIDEAYGLIQGDNDTAGTEAINTLLKRLEDDRGKFIAIAAGYAAEMNDFIASNPGLKSRFTDFIHFDDYTPEELAEIFRRMATQGGYQLDAGAEPALARRLNEIYARRDAHFGNARTVRNLFDQALQRLSDRIMALQMAGGLSDADLRREADILRAQDLGEAGAEAASPAGELDAALAELHALVGLDGVKDAVARLRNTLEAQRLMGETGPMSRHFVFTGNPGTGKTTVARILARIFHTIGLLPSATLIEVDRGDLVAGYQGQTARNVNRLCDQAMGGVLFVDEAYDLNHGPQDSFGHEAINTLLKRMEDDRGKFVVIAAGYAREMADFIASNSGLKSRFSDFIDFTDYAPADMVAIFRAMMARAGIQGEADFDAALLARMADLHAGRGANFANARTVRQIFDKTVENVSHRVMAQAHLDEAAKRRDIKRFQAGDLDQRVTG